MAEACLLIPVPRFLLSHSRRSAYHPAAMPRTMKIPDIRLRRCDPRRICLIKPSALGDVVQALPLLPALRLCFPQAEMHWVINRDFAPLLEGHPLLTEVIPFDRRGSWRDFARLLVTLRRRRFDLVFDLQGLLRSAVMTLATGAGLRLGLQTAREGSGWACHALLPGTGRRVPAHQRIRNIIAPLAISGGSAESGLHIPLAARGWARERLVSLPRPMLAIHPGAGWETKRWPAEKFAAVAARFAGSVVTIGSGGEQPLTAPIAGAIRAAGKPGLDLTGSTSLPQLAAVLDEADVLLSNDSGPMHLAAAAGTPVVGIFTCTSPWISGPAGAGHEVVATCVSCAASYRKRCPQRGTAHLGCLAEIPVERVEAALQRVLERLPARRHSA